MTPQKRKLYIKLIIIWLLGLVTLFWHATGGGGFKNFEADMKSSIQKAAEEP